MRRPDAARYGAGVCEDGTMRNKASKWIKKTRLFRSDVYVCFNCGFSAARPSKVCPGCGAVMKGTRYDPTWVDEMEMIDAFLDD